MQCAPFGFRILGPCTESRRLVKAAAAFSGYAACDERANAGREGYLSAFSYGDEFRQQLETTRSTQGYKGPCWSPWLWFDIDCEDDLERALKHARQLCGNSAQRYGLDDDELLIFFSGSKGFHVGLPTSLWTPQPSTKFNRVCRRLAEQIADRVGIKIDTGVYDKVRAFRASNSRHPKTGLYKRRLSYEELLHLSIEAIQGLATKPEPFDLPDPPDENDQAVADWREAVEMVNREDIARQKRADTNGNKPALNRGTLEFIRNGAQKGERHLLLFSAAANLAEFDCPTDLAHALLTESARDCGLPPRDVRRQIECGLSTVDSNSTLQDAAQSPQRSQDDAKDQNAAECVTDDSGGSEGHCCQQLSPATNSLKTSATDDKKDIA